MPNMGKRSFTIDLGNEKIEVEGHQHKNVAIKYLMKRRRSLLMTRDKDKVERLFEAVPKTISNNNRKFVHPVVLSPGSAKPKVGTGWSMGEILSAGLTRKQMKKLHLRIDKFRRTIHEDNVAILKKIKPSK